VHEIPKDYFVVVVVVVVVIPAVVVVYSGYSLLHLAIF
jgi:hypothetical protein